MWDGFFFGLEMVLQGDRMKKGWVRAPLTTVMLFVFVFWVGWERIFFLTTPLRIFLIIYTIKEDNRQDQE